MLHIKITASRVLIETLWNVNEEIDILIFLTNSY